MHVRFDGLMELVVDALREATILGRAVDITIPILDQAVCGIGRAAVTGR
jgi:hypothetical protein